MQGRFLQRRKGADRVGECRRERSMTITRVYMYRLVKEQI